ncbi:Glycosyl transferase, group 2 family [hydrothermal vent metagenome]|uniref:Glycosyl transferase, group 2 family n=1 Tax=hydrothermal vent metagenome TaxID=652676 RepID=A0A3B1BIV3_9ZZZZ
MTSLIIPVKGRVRLTLSCLTSLKENDLRNLKEIIIVDNNSDHTTAKALEEFSWSKIKIVRTQKPLNFAESCNLGAKTASGDIIGFMNNDITISEGWLETMLEAQSINGGVVGARLLYPDGRVQHGGEVLPLWGIPFIGGTGAPGDDLRYDGARERWAVIAALMFVSRDLFERVGGFDEGYIFGIEDVDFCLKVRGMGEKVVCVGSCRVTHHESGTLSGLPDKRRNEWLRLNMEKFTARWSELIERLTARYVENLKKSGVNRVALHGTGAAGLRSLEILQKGEVMVTAFLDSGAGRKSKSLKGIPIINIEDALNDADCILIATQSQWEVEKRLKSFGLETMTRDIELADTGWKPGDYIA